MAWIESHQEVARHPKTRRLALKLGVSRVTAIGHLHLLWWWALSFAQDGDLTSIEPETIAEEAMWDGEPGAFLAALRESGWLDATDGGRLMIHDWHKYAGKLIDARKKDAERKREARIVSDGRPSDVQGWGPTDVQNGSHGDGRGEVETPASIPNESSGAPQEGGGARISSSASDGRPSDVRRTSEVTVPYPTVPYRTVPNHGGEANASPRAAPDDETGSPKRPDQAIFDVLVRRFGEPTNAQERGKFNKAVQLFRQSGCDDAETDALIAEAEARWGAVEITPVGVAGNVGNLRRPARSPPKNGRAEGAVDQIRRLAGRGSSG